MRRTSPVFCALASVLTFSAAARATEGPHLRSATSRLGHIHVAFTLGDLARAGKIQVATRARRGAGGAFLPANVRLRERIVTVPNPVTRLLRWRTRRALPRGTYYVEVSGVDVGETSCLPRGADCLEQWSNALKVVIRRPAH